MQTTAKKNNEFHDLLDSLVERQIYGEVTLYIQAGNIESCRISERHTKSEIKAMLEKKEAKPRVLTSIKAVAGGNV